MKSSYPFSRPKLARVLLELLRHPEVRLDYRPLRDCVGRVDWSEVHPPTNIVIAIDANALPLDHTHTVIHELLHVVFHPNLIGILDDRLTEIFMLALDADIYAYVKASPKRLAAWQSAIASKLPPPPEPSTYVD